MEENSSLHKMFIDVLLIPESQEEEFLRELHGENGKELEKQIKKIIKKLRNHKYEYV